MTSEEIMKKCQTGFGNYQGALDDANNLLAECYGHIGKLESRLNEVLFFLSSDQRHHFNRKWSEDES